jgi:hypothetical protein
MHPELCDLRTRGVAEEKEQWKQLSGGRRAGGGADPCVSRDLSFSRCAKGHDPTKSCGLDFSVDILRQAQRARLLVASHRLVIWPLRPPRVLRLAAPNKRQCRHAALVARAARVITPWNVLKPGPVP